MFETLNQLSPLDGRYAPKTAELRPFFSESALMRYRLQSEIRWLSALANEETISELSNFSNEQQQFLQAIFANFDDVSAKAIKSIEATTNHDVKAVEYFLKTQCEKQSDFESALPFIHFAATSEDINNVAYALMCKGANETVIVPALQTILSNLKSIASNAKSIPMLSRTHGQAATPTTLGKEIAVFFGRLEPYITKLQQFKFSAKFAGASGNLNAHCVAYPNTNWTSLTQQFIESMNLTFNQSVTQIEPHDNLCEYLLILSQINTILIDFSRDIWSYISLDYFKLNSVAGEVGSSTMPHKVNPIDFENAEGNLGLSNALIYHLAQKLPVSRMQRDLSDSTVLRNIGVCLGYHTLSIQSLSKGISKLEANEAALNADLEKNYAVLTEAIQTLLRKNGDTQAYEKLKDLSRGKEIDANLLNEFISKLDIDANDKARLLALAPATYIGLSTQITDTILNSKTK